MDPNPLLTDLPVLEFGLRRAQGVDGAMAARRAHGPREASRPGTPSNT